MIAKAKPDIVHNEPTSQYTGSERFLLERDSATEKPTYQPDPPSLLPGTVLNERYRILRHFSAGGMGEVYLAIRLALGDQVVVKRLLSQRNSAEDRRRFLAEAQTAAHIRHPHVVNVFDFGEDADGSPFMVMEYLEGPTLAEEMAKRPLPLNEAISLFAPICSAIEAGHRRKVIHRDIKPSNIILSKSDDGRQVVKVLDFGLARAEHLEPQRITNPGMILGTSFYMSPEQATGSAISPASDIFCLGILLYEMVTGTLPFRGKTVLDTIFKIASGHYTNPREFVPELPITIETAIRKALSIKVEERPASAEQLARLTGIKFTLPPPDLGSGPQVASFPSSSQLRAAHPISTSRIHARSPVTLDSNGTSGVPTQNDMVPVFDHFVGRTQEQFRLHEEFFAALQGKGRFLIVQGEEGVGKTTLVNTFCQCIDTHYPHILRIKFPSTASTTTPTSQRPSVLLQWLPDTSLESDSKQLLSPRFFSQLLTEQLLRQSPNSPIVLIFENLHHARSFDLEVLDELYQKLSEHQVLFLGLVQESATRPHTTNSLNPWLHSMAARRLMATLPVRPLSHEETNEWLHLALHPLHIRPQDVHKLYLVSTGNPYILCELVRHLIIQNLLFHNEQGWICNILDMVPLPDSIRNAVRARLAELSPALQQVVNLASVIGTNFRFDILHRASQVSEEVLEEVIEEGVRKQVFTDENNNLEFDVRFASPILKIVAYQDLPKRHRRRSHRLVLDALRDVYASNLSKIAHDLAFHYYSLGDWGECFRWSLQSVSQCLEQQRHEQAENAIHWAQQARQAMQDFSLPPSLTDLLYLEFLHGSLYTRIAKFQEAKPILNSLTTLLDPTSHLDRLIDTHLRLSECNLGLGDTQQALEATERAIYLAEQYNDPIRAVVATIFKAIVFRGQGKLSQADTIIRKIIAEDPTFLSPSQRSWLVQVHATIALKLGQYALAERQANLALVLANAAHDQLARHHALSAKACIVSESGNHIDAVPIFSEALQLAQHLNLRHREAIIQANLGEIHYELGQFTLAHTFLQASLSIFVDIHDRASEGDCRVNIGRALLALGRTSDASSMLQRGRELCAEVQRPEYAGIASLELAEIHLQSEQPTLALQEFQLARSLLHASTLLWRAELGCARCLLAQQKPSEARKHARIALELVETQRTQLPPGVDKSGFERAIQPLNALLSELPLS
jgi:eukaryotic-like serine/threonine-protein kinase